MSQTTDPIWIPSAERVTQSNMAGFMSFVRERGPAEARDISDYRSLHRWSVDHREQFWPMVWRFCGIVAEDGDGGEPWESIGIGLDRMAPPDPVLGPRWFDGARLNFAANLLRLSDDHPALVAWNEQGRQRVLSYARLGEEVARVAGAMRLHGIQPCDRVAALMPNIPEAVIAMLAAASVGAVWSSCSPDFGAEGVVDRFGQITPRLLFCADGYRWAGADIPLLQRTREILDQLHSVERTIVVPYLDHAPDLSRLPNASIWGEFAGQHSPVAAYRPLPFSHPLYILYSSGTTGLPKCMVHSAGGTLLQHRKEQVLHVDIRREDRIFYYTTCGWMMWNWLVSALASGACVVLYDGAPLAPNPSILWELAASERVSVFGVSAKYLALCEKHGLDPARSHDLSALRTILSTGSPLAAHGYDYVYDRIKQDVHLSNISGGTEIISCFVLGDPTRPVWRGELQAPGLGMAVDVFDSHGQPVRGESGELVCTRPFPSMPVSFWNDPGRRHVSRGVLSGLPGRLASRRLG